MPSSCFMCDDRVSRKCAVLHIQQQHQQQCDKEMQYEPHCCVCSCDGQQQHGGLAYCTCYRLFAMPICAVCVALFDQVAYFECTHQTEKTKNNEPTQKKVDLTFLPCVSLAAPFAFDPLAPPEPLDFPPFPANPLMAAGTCNTTTTSLPAAGNLNEGL